MLKIDRILCPTDLTPASEEALRYALAFAKAHQAKLILLYCRKPGSLVDWSTSANAARLFQQALFTHLDADELKTLEWEPAIVEADDVGRTIIEEASKRSADLIVIRSRRRPHAAALLGSTAETVSRYAPCPVLVVHQGERECVAFTTCEMDLKRVLVTHDFSAGSELALNYGLSLAQENRSELHLLHILDQEEEDPPEFAWTHVDIESRYQDAAIQLQDAIPQEALLGCTAVTAVRWGNAPEEILSYAENHKIDLICIRARSAGFDLNKLFGSTTEHVLRRANCPVLVARPAVAKGHAPRWCHRRQCCWN